MPHQFFNFNWDFFSRHQLLITPVNILLATLYSMETLFVGFVENNVSLRWLGFSYFYAVIHYYLIVFAQVHSIIDSSAEGRFTGILVHQALTHTNDLDLMLKVCISFFIWYQTSNLNDRFLLARIVFYASIAFKSKMRFGNRKLWLETDFFCKWSKWFINNVNQKII